MRRGLFFIAALAALAIVVLQPRGAGAHATLVASEPAQNGFLQGAPSRLLLTFSEPLDKAASNVQLLDAQGQSVEIGAPQFVPDAPTTMRADLPTLPPGIYNVLWTNVSTVDGHMLNGLFPFTILNPDGSVPDVTNSVSASGGSSSDPAPYADSAAVRGLTFLGALLLMAPATVTLLATEPFSPAIRRGLQMAAWAGVAVFAVALILNLEVLRSDYSGRSVLDTLTGTRVGGAWFARAGALLLAAVTVLGMRQWPRPAAVRLLLCGAVVMGAFAFTSHAAVGPGRGWATLFDSIHGIAALTWVGAVAGLVLVARMAGRAGPYRELLPRISLLASVTVFVLLVTGILNGFAQIDTPDRLTSTRYGVTTLVKLGLIVPLLGFAAWNATRGRRRLVELRPGEPRRFIFTAGAEAFLGIAVIAVAAVLSQTTAAKLVPEDAGAGPYRREETVDGLSVGLSVDPNRTGLNTFEVTLRDDSGELVRADLVRLTFRYQDDQQVGPAELPLTQGSEPGIYGGQGPYLTLEGNWRVEVVVRRADVDDAVAFFDVRPAGTRVAFVDLGGGFDNPAPGLTWNELAGFIIVAVGLGFALWRDPLARTGRTGLWTANVMTVAGFGVGTLLLFGVHQDMPAGDVPTNPIFPDQNSIDRGRELYMRNCASCHGVQGLPPDGLDLDPYPLDLTVHVPQHADGIVYLFIDQGVAGTAMQGWGAEGLLEDTDIWHIVNFLRTLRVPDR